MNFLCFGSKKQKRKITSEKNLNGKNEVSCDCFIKQVEQSSNILNDYQSQKAFSQQKTSSTSCQIVQENEIKPEVQQEHHIISVKKEYSFLNLREYKCYLKFVEINNIYPNIESAKTFKCTLDRMKRNVQKKLVKSLNEQIENEDWIIDRKGLYLQNMEAIQGHLKNNAVSSKKKLNSIISDMVEQHQLDYPQDKDINQEYLQSKEYDIAIDDYIEQRRNLVSFRVITKEQNKIRKR